jgi:hypothetical protein
LMKDIPNCCRHLKGRSPASRTEELENPERMYMMSLLLGS